MSENPHVPTQQTDTPELQAEASQLAVASQLAETSQPADASQEPIKIGVLTSGGDAQGMNAVVRAVIRTALHDGAQPYAVREGWKGAVEGGDLIVPATWSDASGILSLGGTTIGTARCDEFRERSGVKKAVKNLVHNGIDRLVIIGGDGTLTGADELRELWPELLRELVDEGEVSASQAEKHQRLHIAGVVGSIDNDLVGTDMTVGADSALHRIIEAVDAISSTAASHQRTFVIEVMGRRCGYLALMSAISGGCDYVFIPELPPEDGWEDAMCEKLREGRENGRRDSLVIVAEGATDRHGQPITAQQVQQILTERLGEEARVTSLGHVQRGGTPSSYDRWMSTLLGYTAAHEMITADDSTQPMIVGVRHNRLILLPMMETIERTRAVKTYLKEGNWEEAIKSRGSNYQHMIDIFETLSAPIGRKAGDGGATGGDGGAAGSIAGTAASCDEAARTSSPRVGILHAGGLAPGMNPAARAAVKLGIDHGFTMIGIEGGFMGLLEGKTRPLGWADVEGWAEDGGAVLGTRRTIPKVDEYYQLARQIEENRLDALIMIGGFKGYKMVHDMRQQRDRYPAFRIPIVCVPASIDNNLPGSELAIGADTALNNNTEVIDKIRQSASASQRCFVAETMGRKCGYLAFMSALSTGAEQVYLYEDGITLEQLAADTAHMIETFKSGRALYLVVKNEGASTNYTADLMQRIFEEEGGDLFDVRTAVLGHMQQGGNPSPFDRTLAVQMVARAVELLSEQFEQGKVRYQFVGLHEGHIKAYPVSHMEELMDMEERLQHEPWWLGVKDVLYVVADKDFTTPLGRLNIVDEA